MKTQILGVAPADARATAVSMAVELLRRGECVALPTETVYGLAANALDVNAALKIFEAKERPRFDPLIVHLPNREWLPRLTSVPAEQQELVEKLTDAFWPGPLTLVLPRKSIVPDVVTAGLDTVAVRVSAHLVFSEVAARFDGPLAAPSANRFGRISPTEAGHVRAELDGRIPLIVDAGRTMHGLESTIVAPSGDMLNVLRQGPITTAQLRDFAAVSVVTRNARVQAPGQLPSHYAPRTPLVVTNDISSLLAQGKRVGILTFDRLSPSRDLREAAANLFACLRELDAAGYDVIAAEELPEEGLGCAIMDRLRRAAGRPSTQHAVIPSREDDERPHNG